MGSSQSITQPKQQQPECVKKAATISPRLAAITSNILKYLSQEQFQSLLPQLNKLTYNTSDIQSPVCSKQTSKWYQCQNCELLQQSVICHECFVPALHQGHTFREISIHGYCDCGWRQGLKSTAFCSQHSMQNQSPNIDKELLNSFLSEMGFMISQLFELQHRGQELHITKNSVNAYAINLIDYLIQFCAKGYVNKYLLHLLMLTQVQEGGLMMGQEKQSVIQKLFVFGCSSQFIQKVIKMHYLLFYFQDYQTKMVSFYFKHLTNPNPNKFSLRLYYQFCNIVLMFRFPITQQQYLQNTSNPKLVISTHISAPQQVQQNYRFLFNAYFDILTFSNATNIIRSVFSQIEIGELCNFQEYYVNETEEDFKIKNITVTYFFVIRGVIQKLRGDQSNKQLIAKIARDAYAAIQVRKSVTFNQALQRTFTLAVFAYFDFNLPTLSQLSKLLGLNIPVQSITHMIINYLSFRDIYSIQYDKMIIKGVLPKGSGVAVSIAATDKLYLRMLGHLLGQRQGVIVQLMGNRLATLVELMNRIQDESEQLSHLKQRMQIIQINMVKLNSDLTCFMDAFETNDAQILVADHVSADKKYNQVILWNLLLVHQNMGSADFKARAEEYIGDQSKIIQFFKNNIVVDGKKVHFKNKQQRNFNRIFRFAQYIKRDMDDDSFANILENKLSNEERQTLSTAILSPAFLKFITQALTFTLNFVQKHQTATKNINKELAAILQTLILLYLQTNSSELLPIIDRIKIKVNQLPYHVQRTYNKIQEIKGKTNQNKEAKNTDKKKQKMNALKKIQNKVLQTYQNSMQKVQHLQCIICKNSKQGSPCLLGHFRYSNFYSGILGAQKPFVEFTSCGHSIHEECLTDSHKGQFRIWYPCVLCKSIANVLMPIIKDEMSSEQKMKKVVYFLKNFGAIYSFFFQETPELREFTIDDVQGVFTILYKSLVYQISICSLVNFQFFVRSQYHFIKFIYKLLKIASQKVPQFMKQVVIPMNGRKQFVNVFEYTRLRLQEQLLKLDNLPHLTGFKNIINKQTLLLIEEILDKLNADEELQYRQNTVSAQYKNIAVQQMYKLPSDLHQLQNSFNACDNCKQQSQFGQICLLCSYKLCQKCKPQRRTHSLKSHICQSIFIKTDNGRYTYVHDQLQGQFSSVYYNYLGDDAKCSTSISPSAYTLNATSVDKIIGDFLSSRLHRQIMKFYN